MKRIAVTQRVESVTTVGERRDALDQRWIDFLLSIDLLPVLVPNKLEYVRWLTENDPIDGVLLTGGNSLVRYEGDAPERDEVEYFLLQWIIKKNIPVLGVCRGMQVIQEYFRNELEAVPGHVATRHSLIVEEGRRLSDVVSLLPDVNAYHDFGAMNVKGELLLVASSLDGTVMALEHNEKNIFR